MYDFLDGIEKRIEFYAIVESIANRSRNMEIETEWFDKKNKEIDCLFIMLLVYIMERTLSEDKLCTLVNIAEYLDQVLRQYFNKSLPYDKAKTLAKYMVEDVLMNDGTKRYFNVVTSTGDVKETQIKLISSDYDEEQKTVIYKLEDQGYEFLFKTKEVDKQFDFKLEQLKLTLALQKRNYGQAVGQSVELIRKLRMKRKELEAFIERAKRNVYEVSKFEYETVFRNTYSLIDEEYKDTEMIMKSVQADEERIKTEQIENGYMDETMEKAMKSLSKIKKNLNVVMAEQRNLISSRFSMNKLYEDILRSSFYTSVVKRYDFDKEIIQPFTKLNDNNIPFIHLLWGPLLQPEFNKVLNLELLYQRQNPLKEEDDTELDIYDEPLAENDMQADINFRNSIYLSILQMLFEFAKEKSGKFLFSEFYEHVTIIRKKVIKDYTGEKRIFLTMLSLYSDTEGKIDIDEWRGQKEREDSPSANGEFNLSWCLHNIENWNSEMYWISSLDIEKTDTKVRLQTMEEIEAETIKSFIEMDDFVISPHFRERGEYLYE